MDKRYAVTITAADRQQLHRLADYELDLHHQTAKATLQRQQLLAATASTMDLETLPTRAAAQESRQFSIDGALTLEEIGRLVDDGYVVTVSENLAKRSQNARETITAQDWLKQMGFEK